MSLVTLAALLLPNALAADSRVISVKAEVYALASAVNLFIIDHGRFPADLRELVEPPEGTIRPYVARLPLDPWGAPYEYSLERPKGCDVELDFYVWSNGSDRQPGGEGCAKDFGNWSRGGNCPRKPWWKF
ncbi:MAG: type II secretion system protein GspG [Pseudomonadota bacterium]